MVFSFQNTIPNSDRIMNNLISNHINSIVKSAEDKRLYRGLELANRMKVLLVSDPTTDKSSAALDVNVGESIYNNCLIRIY